MMIWMDVDATLASVPVNAVHLIDDTDFKTREDALTYDQAGLDLKWVFTTTAGTTTSTSVTPTTGGGDYDWTNLGNGYYGIGIPASGGASISNDTEGFGHFEGYATGVLPWVGPTIGFRAASLNNALIDSAWSTTRGLAGTALPDAAADAAGGLPISDAGGLDLDTKLANTNEVTAARMGALTDWIDGGRLDLLLDAIKVVTDALPEGGALTTLLADAARLTAARAGALTDWIDGGRLDLLIDAIKAKTDLGLLNTTWTDAKAGYLTGNVALASVCTEARLAELDAANVPADVDTLLSRLSAARAGYLDELAAANIPADVDAITAKMPTNYVMGSSDQADHDADFDAVTLANGAHGGAAATLVLSDYSNFVGSSSAPQLLQSTTIATLASQTSFTLTAGSADDDAYNNALVIVTDSATSTQKAVGYISDYTGASLTVELAADPGIFTMAVGDTIDIIAVHPQAIGGATNNVSFEGGSLTLGDD